MLSSNILQGKRVRLTALTRDALPAFSAWYDDAGFSRLLDAVPAAPRSQKQWQKWLEKSEEAKDSFTFAIRPTGMDTLNGYLEIDGILWNQQSGWISIGLGDRDKWGQGYGFEAM